MKKLGVLGGIGPEASSYFYSEVIRRLRERGAVHQNADYPQIIINSINAPELTILELTDEMLAPYTEGIKELVKFSKVVLVDALPKRSNMEHPRAVSHLSHLLSQFHVVRHARETR